MRSNQRSRHGGASKKDQSSDKETESRTNSGPKPKVRVNPFLESVRMSMEIYSHIDKEDLKRQQLQILKEKERKLQNLKKKEFQPKMQEIEKIMFEKKEQRSNKRKQQKKLKEKKIKRQSLKPTRISSRISKPISFFEPNYSSQQEYCDQDVSIKENQSKILPNQELSKVVQVVNLVEEDEEDKINPSKRQTHKQKVPEPQSKRQIKCKQQYIQEMIPQIIQAQNLQKNVQDKYFDSSLIDEHLQNEGTYQIGMAHQNLLKIQKRIDDNLSFKHQIRGLRSILLKDLVSYLKNEGFTNFSPLKFNLIQRINPYLYKTWTDPESDQIVLAVYKLSGLQIEQRQQSTRRRMSQMSIPQLFT